MVEKRCRQCGRIRPISEFGKTASSRDGYYKECLDCQDENKQRKRERKNRETWDKKTSVCRICGHQKPSYEFASRKYSSGEFEYCRICIAVMCRNKYHKYEQEREIYGYPVEKHCIECGRLLPSDNFNLDRCHQDGLSDKCKDCGNEQRQQWIKQEEKKRLKKPIPKNQTKECMVCHQLKPFSKFTKDMSNKDGYSLRCIKCTSVIRQDDIKAWTVLRKENIKKGIELVEMQCRKCNRILPIEMFSKNISVKSGYYNFCKDCHKQREKDIEIKWERERKKSMLEFSLDVEVEKKCKSCERILPLSMFWKRRASKDGRSHYCQDCYKKNVLERRVKLKKRGIIPELIPDKKYCPGCKKTLSHEFFRFDSTSGDCLDGQCRDCRKKYYAEYSSRSEVKKKQKDYDRQPEVMERRRKQARKYYRKPGVKERQREYKREYIKRPEVKERRKAYNGEFRKRPEVKKRKSEYYKRPEVRKYRNELQRERRLRKKLGDNVISS